MAKAHEYARWRGRCGFTKDEAAERLGIPLNEGTLYELDQDRLPRHVKDNMAKLEALVIHSVSDTFIF